MTFVRTSARVVGGVALAALLVFAMPQTAFAHDQIIGQIPNENEVLEVAPSEITLEFTGELMDITQLAMVVDADGTDWVSGPMQVTDRTAIQPLLPDMPEGSYQVRWRVVSSDGHPISGSFEFAVGQETPGATFGLEEEASEQEDTAASATDTSTTGMSPLVVTSLIGAGSGIVLFAGVIAARWFWIRRKK
ncbi:copper resistance protein CopC [Salinibacterium sp. NSLL16]|uniref:copper resistance CopC family protein n=1 Tax=unclassified Salinibacterium TaxID=2632331 RepID=UPI0018CED6DA|nr:MULTISPECIES: copper resistance protein CopC [unclassified Salinibacterium]MBH0103885.1 copper resistance protein CopC [Salinibacterium sp. NSLL16]MBH0106646.1 copper resistance protein CopC [Salinibacterium sp. NSLL17]